jgi:hypothetical protein
MIFGWASEAIANTLAAGLRRRTNCGQGISSNLSDDSKYDVANELKVKQAQFSNALAESLGISVLATLAPERADGTVRPLLQKSRDVSSPFPGQDFWVKVHETAPAIAIQVENVAVRAPENVMEN